MDGLVLKVGLWLRLGLVVGLGEVVGRGLIVGKHKLDLWHQGPTVGLGRDLTGHPLAAKMPTSSW